MTDSNTFRPTPAAVALLVKRQAEAALARAGMRRCPRYGCPWRS